jgi:uncharacterized protein (DUF885 family)
MPKTLRKELIALTDDYLHTYCATYPNLAVWLGFHEYDGRLPDLSRSAIEARAADLRRFLADLDRIDPTDLDDLGWLDYRVVYHQAGFEAFVLEDWRRWERDPLYYLEALDVSNYVLRNYAPLEQRVRALVAHLRGSPAVLEAMQGNLTQVSQPVLRIGVRIAKGSLAFLTEELPQALAGLEDPALQAEFEAASREAISLMEQAAAWLENDLAPRATADYALGPERFSRMLWLGEAVDLPLGQLQEVAEADLVRNKAAYLETASQIGPGRDPREVIAEGLRNHPAPDNLVAETRQMVDELRRIVIEYGVVSVPYDENCIVAETPSFLRAAFAMLYGPGPFEQVAKEAYYYVTPPEPDWPPEKAEEWMSGFAYHVLRSATVHEAWPGHYLHELHIRNAPSKMTKAFGAYSFFEAWAHYVEQMMLEIGWRAEDPWARMGQLSEALSRNVRFVCALGLHTGGMTVEEAAQRFIEDAFMEQATAEEEALRGTGDPQYLSYTLGKLMLLKLREDVKAREGESFDLRAFHDQVLAYGAPPVPLVRAMMLGRDDRDIL